MKKCHYKKPEFWISAIGLTCLETVFVMWYRSSGPISVPGAISAFTSTVLFAAVCLRFVPEWMIFWSKNPARVPMWGIEPADKAVYPKYVELKIFISLLLANVFVVLIVYVLWLTTGHTGTFLEGLNFWTCADSIHYLDIAKEGYLSAGEWDRLVQLVFLPGYPLAVRLLNCIVGNYLYSGMLVSAFSFAGAGCVIYRLLRLDFSHEDAIRTIKYFRIIPGAFFFTAPMSESLFLLLCASCLYCARTKKWLLGCLFGGLASFTRSLGLTLFVPLFFEMIHNIVQKKKSHHVLPQSLALLLVPAGFLAYCYINYLVSGNPLKFMEYQSENWDQHLGWFFNTAAYQLDMAISCYETNNHNLLGLWIPNLLSSFVSLVLMLMAAKKMRPSYTAWFIAYYLIAIGATWLLSAPRYLIALIPVPLAVSILARGPENNLLAVFACVILGFLYLCAFVLRWQVW